ncbi:hypothetical protein [Rufibacter radiotolerans]|nr:hypothetical protein [Rufibacter radiotolerans]
MLLFVYFLFSAFVAEQKPDYEQLAVEHFFLNALPENYPDLKSVEFNPRTDTSLYIGIVMTCKHWEEETKKKIYDQLPEKSRSLRISESGIKIKKVRNWSNRLNIAVSPSRQVGNKHYVSISAYKKLRFVDHYIFEFNQEGRIIDICKTSEVI